MTSPLWPVSRGGKGLELSWETQRQVSISDLRPTSSQRSASSTLCAAAASELSVGQMTVSLCLLFNHVNNLFCLIVGGDNYSLELLKKDS